MSVDGCVKGGGCERTEWEVAIATHTLRSAAVKKGTERVWKSENENGG